MRLNCCRETNMAHTMHTSGATATRAHKCCCSRSTPQHHHHHHRQTRCRSSPQDIVQLAPHITTLADVHLASALHLLDLQAGASAAVAAASAPADVPAAVSTSAYTPGPVEVGWQIWFAAIVSTVPFVIGAYEFGKRILIQRRCKVCGGNGLVQRGKYQRKCPECGGFFPWISWSMFLSANARPGNGGPLLQPRGQSSVFYTVPPADNQQQGSSNAQAAAMEQSGGEAGDPAHKRSSQLL